MFIMILVLIETTTECDYQPLPWCSSLFKQIGVHDFQFLIRLFQFLDPRFQTRDFARCLPLIRAEFAGDDRDLLVQVVDHPGPFYLQLEEVEFTTAVRRSSHPRQLEVPLAHRHPRGPAVGCALCGSYLFKIAAPTNPWIRGNPWKSVGIRGNP